MKKSGFAEAIAEIVVEHPAYDAHAYQFVREGLEFTIKLYAKPVEGEARHVTGGELMEGLRRYALQEYGPLAHRVLNYWGVRRTEDFGQVVFNMVEKGVLGKTEEDRIEHFANGYDFDEAFLAPFRADAEAPAESTAPEAEN